MWYRGSWSKLFTSYTLSPSIIHAWIESQWFLYIREAKLRSRRKLFVVGLIDVQATIVFVEHVEIRKEIRKY